MERRRQGMEQDFPRWRVWWEAVVSWIRWYDDAILSITLVVMICLLLGALWAVGASFEAEAFTRITGRQVSTWDAMWLSLRVDCR